MNFYSVNRHFLYFSFHIRLNVILIYSIRARYERLEDIIRNESCDIRHTDYPADDIRMGWILNEMIIILYRSFYRTDTIERLYNRFDSHFNKWGIKLISEKEKKLKLSYLSKENGTLDRWTL